MSPINFGQLPSDQPVPTGLCQIKRGVSNVSIAVTAASGVVALQDGAGAPMRISITPPRPGMWLIRAETMWVLSDAAWYYCHWGVRCVPLDADGRGDDRNHHCIHSALSWTEQVINTAYRLNAGVAYYCEMYWPASANAGTWNYHCYPEYHYISGEFLEDGSL
jgi:hypothetical protein